MYGLPKCACGGTVYNDETGACDTCSDEARITELETEVEHSRERAASLQRELDQSLTDLTHTRSRIAEVEFLLRLGRARALDELAGELGSGGYFHIRRADEVLPGDRLLRPVRAVTAARLEGQLVLTFAGGERETTTPAQPLAVWTPADPHQTCGECGLPMFTGCTSGCRADQIRSARLALAAEAAERPQPGRHRSQGPYRPPAVVAVAAHTALRGQVTAWDVGVQLRPAAWNTSWPGINAMFERLTRALNTLPDPVNASQFTVADAYVDCRDGEWDLAAAAAILTAHRRAAPDRITGALFWARIEPDGTLLIPNERLDDVATIAKTSGRTLITALGSGHSAPPGPVRAFATFAEAAAWMVRPTRP